MLMKIYTIIFLSIALILATSAISYGQNNDATKKIKTYINKVVQKVEEAEHPDQKRAVLNKSFDKMLKAFDRIEGMKQISENDKEGIALLKENIQDKKNELNGQEGYQKVADSQLNNFANYVQQDMEQAKSITIGVTTLLLIIIIILLI